MSDYISKDALRLLKVAECEGHTIDYAIGWKACVDYLKALPSADVAPVERSRWIKTEDGAECENCGREAVYQIVDDHWEYEDFCPHCGARMDGKE